MSDVVKKPLSIIIADGSTSHDYLKYLDIMFDVKVLKFEECKANTQVDLILFTGGEDVDPGYYMQNKGKYTYSNKDRDRHEQKVIDSYYQVPKLGICRGAQFLTVMAGGTLIQHVTGHGQAHTIDIKDYGEYTIPSTHHQMMYPFDMKADRYEIIAHASNFRSNTYLNGNNEEMKLHSDFLEPEIVKYNNINAFCIQGHPEFENAEDNTKKVTLQLIYNWLFPNDPHRYEPPKKEYGRIFFSDEMTDAIQNLKRRSANKPIQPQYLKTVSAPKFSDGVGLVNPHDGISGRYVSGSDSGVSIGTTPVTFRYETIDMGNGYKATQAIPVTPDQALPPQQDKQEE